MPIDPIELARELIAFNTINPPSNELDCIKHLERILVGAGLETSLQNFAPNRANLIARIRGASSKPPLCFTGHVDTVPLGNASWSMDPFAGEIIDSKMYGRGSTDMKCGVAAFVAAIANLAQQLEGTGGALLVITAGEEVGCEGAFHMARAGILGRAGAIVVAEPTSNAALIGHKGALWLRLTLKGVTAHGSMPHLGVNAAFKAARAITALEGFQFNVAPHPSLGFPTLKARTAPYFTDASALTPAFGNPPTVILGPGEAAKAHQTDEYCSVRRVHQACDIYGRLAGRWVSTAI